MTYPAFGMTESSKQNAAPFAAEWSHGKEKDAAVLADRGNVNCVNSWKEAADKPRHEVAQKLFYERDARRGETGSSGDDLVAQLKGLVTQIYEEHDASRIGDVDRLFEKYKGLERELYVRICKKHGKVPKPEYEPSPEAEDDSTACDRHPATVHNQEEQQKLNLFLKGHGFEGVNACRKTMMQSFYPLHTAVQYKSVEMIELLLAARADPALKNSTGRTPVQLAAKSDKRGSHAAVLEALGGA